MTKPICGTCKWWKGRISGRVYTPGLCVRYPPPNETTQINHFCGEYREAAALGIAQGRTKAEAEIVALREQARKEAAMLRKIAKSEARGLAWQANLTATADFLERLEHKEPRP